MRTINLFSKLESDKKKILLIVMAGLIVLYLDLSLILKMQLGGIRSVRPKIIKMQKDLQALSKDLALMQEAKYKQPLTKQKSSEPTQKFISEDEIAALLEDISDIANKNSVKIMQIKPSKELKAKDERLSQDISKLAPLLVILDLSCDYHRLGKFINDLENAKQFIALQEIKIIPDSSDYLHQNVNLVLKTYVKK